MSKILVVGGSGFIGSYLMKEIDADNIDLKEGKDVRDGIDKKYDVIIFLACNQEGSVPAYEDNREMYEVLNNYRKQYDTYLIYISSAAVYNLNSRYALSKQLGETYAQRFDKWAILRLSNVYGHGDGHGAPDRFMRGENTIHGDGKQIRDLIPVETVVTNILACINNEITGIFNISSGRGTTVNQMFNMFGHGRPKYKDSHPMGVRESILKPGKVE